MTVPDGRNQGIRELAEQLYERFGKPLETKHLGEYVAISPSGNIVLGTTVLEVADKAAETLGPDNYIFKVGERSVGRWRWLLAQ